MSERKKGMVAPTKRKEDERIKQLPGTNILCPFLCFLPTFSLPYFILVSPLPTSLPFSSSLLSTTFTHSSLHYFHSFLPTFSFIPFLTSFKYIFRLHAYLQSNMSITGDKPTVLIVGAGLGGLMLGALLEKSDVPYMIFERANAVKPLGTSTCCCDVPSRITLGLLFLMVLCLSLLYAIRLCNVDWSHAPSYLRATGYL